jgi:hypothetical protein
VSLLLSVGNYILRNSFGMSLLPQRESRSCGSLEPQGLIYWQLCGVVPPDGHLQGPGVCVNCALTVLALTYTRSHVLSSSAASVFCYLGGRNPIGWPHTVQLGEPNCQGSEALPHQ